LSERAADEAATDDVLVGWVEVADEVAFPFFFRDNIFVMGFEIRKEVAGSNDQCKRLPD
jgi:hypothetical protein